MISVSVKGEFRNLKRFLSKKISPDILSILNSYGAQGVSALAAATPQRSGRTAAAWQYRITSSYGSYRIAWYNTHVNNGIPIAIILQYGHGTGTGGYVPGIDYINPAIRPIFEQISRDGWKAVVAR